MHNLAASFVLGYHGCDTIVAESLLKNEAFTPSENTYDWLGSGIYFWESNPDRALAWAHDSAVRNAAKGKTYIPAVVGAVIDLGFCLDLISSNGIIAVEQAYKDYRDTMVQLGKPIAKNVGGDDLRLRHLDCDVLNYLHNIRKKRNLPEFDTVKGVFIEGQDVYPTAGFRAKTHIQISVRSSSMIKGVFRVPQDHFSSNASVPSK